MSSEHIVPLSLGGVNGFELPVSKEFNTSVGSQIDGLIGKQLPILARRTNFKVKGHSGKTPEMYFKNARLGNTDIPLQVKVSKDQGILARAPYLPDNTKDVTGEYIKLSTRIDLEVWLKYVAKVALSAGYFAYGEQFRDKVNTDNLRHIMNKSNQELIRDHSNMKVDAHGFCMEVNSPKTEIYKGICKSLTKGSCVGIVPSDSSMSIFTGILGCYIGTISVEADTRCFKNEGPYYWGHFMWPLNGKLVRTSYKRLLETIASKAPNTETT